MDRSNLINWTARSSRDMCVNWNKPQVSRLQLCEQPSALWRTLEYELVDTNGVCQGIQKVRVEPATRSAVATCTFIQYKCMYVPFLIQVSSKLQGFLLLGVVNSNVKWCSWVELSWVLEQSSLNESTLEDTFSLQSCLTAWLWQQVWYLICSLESHWHDLILILLDRKGHYLQYITKYQTTAAITE